MQIYFSENTALYFYSALLQANAAIIALIGLYTIFKIQSLQTRIDTITTALIATGLHNKVRTFEISNYEEKKKYIVAWKDNDYFRSFNTWMILLNQIKKSKNSIVLPTVLLTIALVSDAIFLLSASTLHKYHPIIELIFGVINLTYEILILIIIAKGIIKTVKVNSEEVNDS